MIVVIDNYDSFTYNLVQYLGELGASVDVVRNDRESVASLLARKPQGVVVSPGPGAPQAAGVSVELVREAVPEGAVGVDLGTGSGAIAIALCVLRPDLRMIATDLSPAALEVASHNAQSVGVADRIEFREGDFWEALDQGQRLDFVVSNPPYVDPARPELLDEEVGRFEPALALFTPAEDPAAAYRVIAAGLSERLCVGGKVFLETGVAADQAGLQALQACPGLRDVELRSDDAGLPRYLLAEYAGSEAAG